jgi:hypothetical protein
MRPEIGHLYVDVYQLLETRFGVLALRNGDARLVAAFAV